MHLRSLSHHLLALSSLLLVASARFSLNALEREDMVHSHNMDAYTEHTFFELHDLDHDGKLSPAELEALYSQHASHEATELTKTLVQDLLAHYDTNGDGGLSETEYLQAKGIQAYEAGQSASPQLRNGRFGRGGFKPEQRGSIYRHRGGVAHPPPVNPGKPDFSEYMGAGEQRADRIPTKYTKGA